VFDSTPRLRGETIASMAGLRASQADRDRAALRLRQGWLSGAVSTDTFVARLGLALGARERAQLRTLTHDLPNRPARTWRWLSSLTTATQRHAADPPLILQLADDERHVTLGRRRSCARVYDDESISRHHALITRTAGSLVVHDLDSTNGTWLNGRRISGNAQLRDGDELRLGRLRLEFRVD
jgi:hypothetical protein